MSAFKVTPKKYAAASTVISVRVPKDMAQALDTLADETGRTRNELIVMALGGVVPFLSFIVERRIHRETLAQLRENPQATRRY